MKSISNRALSFIFTVTLSIPFFAEASNELNFNSVFNFSVNAQLNSALPLAPPCTLPVCDIPDRIAQLRAGTREERASFYANLSYQYRSSRDSVVLANLIEFSQQAYKLSIELDSAEDYVPKLAEDLLNRSLDSILSQGPLVGQTYGQWYAQFEGISASSHRYQALLYWDKQLKHKVLTTADEFRQLILFMKLAAAASDKLGDEDYFANFAKMIATQAGIELLRLAPYMEGVYRIQVSCKPIDIALCPKMNRFSLVIGDQWRGIQGAFIQDELENPVFEFNEIKIIDEKTIHGETGPMDVPIAPGSVHLVFDTTLNSFTGSIRTPRTQIEVQVSGQRVMSPDELYQLPKADMVAIDQVEGYYEGQVVDTSEASLIIPHVNDFNFTIARYAENSFKATMRESSSQNIVYDFPALYYFRNVGVINAYTANEHGLLKITWAYRIKDGIPQWVGVAHSLRTGQYFFLDLKAK